MGHRSQVYQRALDLAEHLGGLSAQMTYPLALFVIGVALAKRSTVRLVAEHLPGVGRPDTVERRLQRSLAHPQVRVRRLFPALTRWVLGQVGGRGPSCCWWTRRPLGTTCG